MLDLRNRFLMPPLKLGYSDGGGAITPAHHAFYLERSQYLGAVTLEPLYLHKSLREIPTQIGIDDDLKIEGLKKLTESIHDRGAKVIAHLNHPGRMANPRIPGNIHLSSTDRPCENGGAVPRRMSPEDMETVTELFVAGARRAQEAGIDLLELQMGHGYLLAQFISPAVNDRQDDWGGSFENRVRFPLSVLDAVREAVDLPIIVRLSGDEMIAGGIQVKEMIALGNLCKGRHVAALHVSVGTVCTTPPWFFQHMFVPKGKTWELAKQIGKGTGLPVVAVGRIDTREDVERLQEEFEVDYLAVGRALVADPLWVGKILGEVEGAIRPCLACSEGCLGGVRSGTGLRCVVNPRVGYADPPLETATVTKTFAVAGGGLAGMEAALTLHRRGHKVTIYEKDRLGGQFNLAWLPPKKESLKALLEYYEGEILRAGIPVIQKTISAEELVSGDAQEVVVATGAVPLVPPIEGLNAYYWAEFLEEENLPQGEKILIIGGGLIGIEIASKLVDKGNEVIIVEMLEEIARGMEMIERTLTLKKLAAKNAPIYTNYRVIRIENGDVQLDGDPPLILHEIDKIVVATGMRSRFELAEELEGRLPVHVIGDARRVGNAQEAIRDGFATCREL